MTFQEGDLRPRQWFGPDDWAEGDDPKIDVYTRTVEIADWDAEYARRYWQRSFWVRTFVIPFYHPGAMLSDLKPKETHK